MRIDVVTLFPALVDAITAYGVVGRARERGLVEVATWNPRDYTADRHRTVDDRPYGGGPGMVMCAGPLSAAIRAARAAAGPATPAVYLTPQGRRLDQAGVRAFAARPGLILVAGRYEGVDERVIEAEIDEEWSIGDYVLSGGEPAVLVLVDAVVRLLPGVLGAAESAGQDSFSAGLLEYPQYTRPEVFAGRRVPPVLLGGDHGAVRRWRLKQALGRTWRRRPELLEALALDAEARALLEEYVRECGRDAD